MNVAVIVGHPDPSAQRLGRALADRYAQAAAAAGNEVRRIDLAALEFPILRTYDEFYHEVAPEGVRGAQSDIAWADHIVFFFPLWIGDVPALLKAFVEQTFRPGFAIDVERHAKLLAGKTARLVVTMGMPAIVYRTYFGAHMLKSLKRSLGMCGIAPVYETIVGSLGNSGAWAERKWLERMACLARCDARRRRRAALKPLRIATGLGVLAAAAYAGYVVTVWARFGRRRERSALLEGVMPEYDARVYHDMRIGAPASLTFDTMRHSDLERALIVQALFRARRILLRGRSAAREMPGGLLEQLDALGWRIVAEQTGRELVFAAVTKPWQADPVFLGFSADEFLAFNEPGFVKIAFTIRVDSLVGDRSIAGSETRVLATDQPSRARLRWYWALLSPGIEIIRIVLLAQLKAEAEARQRERSLGGC